MLNFVPVVGISRLPGQLYSPLLHVKSNEHTSVSQRRESFENGAESIRTDHVYNEADSHADNFVSQALFDYLTR